MPREIKPEEHRVALTPQGARELRRLGHTVLLEEGAGRGSGFSDQHYLQAGAQVLDRKALFSQAELLLKVKEPLPEEYPLLREGQALFCFLHLAPNPQLVDVLLKKGLTALAFETLQSDGELPLLKPMSEIAGRMAPLVGAWYLQRHLGGKGVLAPGLAGVGPATCLVLGAGVVGSNAARMALGLGMEVLVLNRGLRRLRALEERYQGRIKTLPLAEETIRALLPRVDILIGAVLSPGERTPVLVSTEMLRLMEPGSVVVDVSVDQGGCVETSRPSTHARPVYEAEGVLHYCVANMPGAYPRTATLALQNATLPYVKLLAQEGVEKALRASQALRTALNIRRGHISHPALARSLGRPFTEPLDIL